MEDDWQNPETLDPYALATSDDPRDLEIRIDGAVYDAWFSWEFNPDTGEDGVWIIASVGGLTRYDPAFDAWRLKQRHHPGP
jgi:hypothetical protein